MPHPGGAPARMREALPTTGNSLQLWLPAAGEAAFTLHTPARAAPAAPVR